MREEPRVGVDLLQGCTASSCRQAIAKFGSSAYVGDVSDPKTVAAYLDLRGYPTIEIFGRCARKRSKGHPFADERKALRNGYVFHPFVKRNHIPDIYGEDGIHRSMPERCGKPMKPNYLRTVEEMGGAPLMRYRLVPPSCPRHWRLSVGAFEPHPGYEQGLIVTSERLVAYIDLVRFGEIVLYSMIIGHGQHLRKGVVGALHATIVRQAIEEGAIVDRSFSGVSGIVYAGMYQGGYAQGQKGLYHWKRKAMFEPVKLVHARKLKSN